jgi:hypothetical protein
MRKSSGGTFGVIGRGVSLTGAPDIGAAPHAGQLGGVDGLNNDDAE